jgi:hypothetical protein
MSAEGGKRALEMSWMHAQGEARTGDCEATSVEKFINEEMAAPNVLRVPIDLAVTRRLGPIARSRIGRLKDFYSKGPAAWRSDIRWYSPRFERGFHRFR